VPNVTINFSQVKAKLQDQNRSTENFAVVIDRPRFNLNPTDHTGLAENTFGMKYDFR